MNSGKYGHFMNLGYENKDKIVMRIETTVNKQVFPLINRPKTLPTSQ